MLWLVSAIISYILLAFVNVGDKIVLNKTKLNPKALVSLLSIAPVFVIFLFPFIQMYYGIYAFIALIAGFIFSLALYFFLKLINDYDASQVVPAISAMIPIFTLSLTYVLSFFTSLEFRMFNLPEAIAFILLIVGTIIINKGSGNNKALFLSFLASFGFSLSFLITKIVYNTQEFIPTFIWSKLGGVVLAILFLIIYPQARKAFSRNKDTCWSIPNILLLLSVQGMGITSDILKHYSFFLVEEDIYISMINSLQGLQYACLLLITLFFTKFFPKILKENFTKQVLQKKVFATILIITGLIGFAFSRYLIGLVYYGYLIYVVCLLMMTVGIFFVNIKFKTMLIYILIFLIIIFSFFFVGIDKEKEKTWGMNFSQKYAKELGLDFKEVYTNLLDDMNVRHLRIAVHWDLIEKEEGVFDFSDIDWQIQEAGKRGAKVSPVIGIKTTRWPECHYPEYTDKMDKEDQQKQILIMLEKVVNRYKDSDVIDFWQIENEPFFAFGKCKWADEEFLLKEIELVRRLDKNHKISVSDSGEGSMWFNIAKLADIPSTTLYRKAWFQEINMYVNYFFPPTFYSRKALLIKLFFGKNMICTELQTEPWGPKVTPEITVEEQYKTMNKEQFKKNISFAKKTDFKSVYMWGGEWMYWLKTVEGNSEVWDEAKKIFK